MNLHIAYSWLQMYSTGS